MRDDTKTMLERKLGYGEGQALVMAIEGGFAVGDRLEHKLGVLMGSDNAAWNFCKAIHNSVELSQQTKNALSATFGQCHATELIRCVEPGEAVLVEDEEDEPAIIFTPNEE